MNRKHFLEIAGGSVLAAGGLGYSFSDKSNFVRADRIVKPSAQSPLTPDEREILYLASLAPSGHNTQPWFVNYIEPYHWIIGNDTRKWLPAVDPTQRETMLSIGAFLQNLEYAASNAGYACQITVLATTNQDKHVADVKLTKSGSAPTYDVSRIRNRRTVRSDFLGDSLKKEDVNNLLTDEADFLHFIPNTVREYQFLNEQTIEANRIQSDRNAAQEELSDWIRFSSDDARRHGDGLTTASMEIDGVAGFFVRNVYTKSSVMKNSFREQAMDKVRTEVATSGGWLLITSQDNETTTLLETGKRMQRLFLTVRGKGIALHPMTQILEETPFSQVVNKSVGLSDPIQFILRIGYVKRYPDPVSIRRPVDWFVSNVDGNQGVHYPSS